MVHFRPIGSSGFGSDRNGICNLDVENGGWIEGLKLFRGLRIIDCLMISISVIQAEVIVLAALLFLV
jgi:hypothetical protein